MNSIIIQSALFIFIYMVIGFLIAQWRRDNSIVDISYGMTYALLALGVYYLYPNTWTLATLVMVGLWGMRLSWHIGQRNIGKGEDWRYRKWRAEWGDKVVVTAFFRVFMLQGFLIWLIAMPIMAIARGISDSPSWTLVSVGVSVWLLGFIYELVADYQLDSFLKNRKPHERIYQGGLWKYSRHPNYFGELLVWWGICIWAIGLTGSWWLVISPSIISLVIIFISAPMIEQKHKGETVYETYYQNSSSIFPKFF